MLLPPDSNSAKGKWITIEVREPVSVCCDEALMVNALLTVGVPAHPLFPFSSTVETVGGKTVRRWRWVVGQKSADGKYMTKDLIKQWSDPAFRADPATSEWAIVCDTLRNMGVTASRIRERVTRVIVRRGRNVAHIPTNASPARRAFLIDKLEGRLPMNASFTEPAA
jgi:hypothetical protein